MTLSSSFPERSYKRLLSDLFNKLYLKSIFMKNLFEIYDIRYNRSYNPADYAWMNHLYQILQDISCPLEHV